MRIASGTVNQYVYFVAVDSGDFTTRETGLTTFTVYRERDNGTATAMTTPTVTESDATNMPGVYTLLMDEDMTIAAGNSTEAMAFHITQAAMAPVTIQIELFRPTVTEGNTLDVTATGAAGIDWANVENPTTAVDLSGTDIQLADTVTTLTGHTAQTGDSYGRLGAPAGASVSADLADVPTVAEFNARTLVAASYFDPAADTVANVTTVATTTTNTDMVAEAPTAAVVADAVWDETLAGHITADTAGLLLNDWQDGGRLDLILDIIAADTTTDIPALIAALNDISEGNVLTQVNAALDTAISELGVAAPAATPTLRTGLMLMYMMTRNKLVTQTSGTDALEVYDDAGVKITSKLITDSAGDYTEAEMT